MDLEDFLQALHEISGKFRWSKDRSNEATRSADGFTVLRGRRGYWTYCPITALARVRLKKHFPMNQYAEAAEALGLHVDVALLIAEAADSALTHSTELYDLHVRLVEAVLF